MKLGLELMTLFFFCLFLVDWLRIGFFMFILPVIWVYSMFDSLHKTAQEPGEEAGFSLFALWGQNGISRSGSKLLGYVLVGLGLLLIFDKYPATVYPGDFKPYIREISHTLLLPAHIAVEINDSGNYFDLDIDGQAIGENWLIKGSGRINIMIAGLPDLDINAYVGDVQQLCGSAIWQPAEIKNETGNTDIKYKGTIQWGTGKNNLKIILESGEIKVDEI